MSAGAVAGTSFIGESIVGVAGKDHVTGAISDAVIGVGGKVVKKLVDFSGSVFSGGRLFGADDTECNEEFVVKSATIP